VVGVRPGGASEAAGIKIGDVLVQLAGADISSVEDVTKVLRERHVGDSIPALIERKGQEISVSVTLGSMNTSAVQTQTVPIQRPTPYKVLPIPAKTGPLLSRLGNGDTAIWLDGKVLSILHRDMRNDIQITGTFQQPMQRIPGSNLWILQMEMDGWEQAFFSAKFLSAAIPDAAPISQFHGVNAPPLPAIAQTLHGNIETRTLQSTNLNEARKITVYIPPRAVRSGLRVLFMADGESCETYAKVAEPLIESGRVAPFVIVGAHAAATADRRGQEYLPVMAPEIAQRHMRFFIEELIPWATREYGLSTDRKARAVFGFSNGGDFAASVALQHGELFGNALPFSMGYTADSRQPPTNLPRFHFVAGELELGFETTTRAMHERVLGWKADSDFTLYKSGHDSLMWQLALAKHLPEVFPAL